MAADWSRRTVSELQRAGILLVEDGNHGENRPRRHEFVSEGTAFIRAADMDAGRILIDKASRITDTAVRRIRKGIGAPGDILLSHKGTIGKVARAPHDMPPFVCSPQTTLWRCLDESILDPGYLYAYLSSPTFRSQLGTLSGETDMAPYVSLTSQRTLQVFLPPLREQRAIAHILGSIDDRIEMSRRLSQTLESATSALFRSWFIDFDPVRTKQDVREPPVPAYMGCLFPDRLVDSELGLIPQGWRVATLGEIAREHRNTVHPSDIIGETPYIALKHMPRRNIALSQWSTTDNARSTKLAFKSGSILFGKLRPYFHKVGVAPIDGLCSTDIVVVTPHSSEWFGYVLSQMSSSQFIDYTDACSTGTRMPRTSWSAMAQYRLVLPPTPIATAFNHYLSIVVDYIVTAIHESRTLAMLRQMLLHNIVDQGVAHSRIQALRMEDTDD